MDQWELTWAGFLLRRSGRDAPERQRVHVDPSEVLRIVQNDFGAGLVDPQNGG